MLEADLKEEFDKPIKASEIFKSFAKIKSRVQSQIEAKEEGGTRFDLLKVTIDEIGHLLTGEKSKKYTEKELNNMADFFIMLPSSVLLGAVLSKIPKRQLEISLPLIQL